MKTMHEIDNGFKIEMDDINKCYYVINPRGQVIAFRRSIQEACEFLHAIVGKVPSSNDLDKDGIVRRSEDKDGIVTSNDKIT